MVLNKRCSHKVFVFFRRLLNRFRFIQLCCRTTIQPLPRQRITEILLDNKGRHKGLQPNIASMSTAFPSMVKPVVYEICSLPQ